MSRWSARRWLVAFRATGGTAWLHNYGIGIGWYVYGRSDDEQASARRLYGDIAEHPLRFDAIRLQVAWSG